MERFKRFRLSVPAVPLQKGFSVFQYNLTGKDGSGSGFGSWKTVLAVPVPLSVSGKTVPTVPAPVPVRFLSHPAKLSKHPQIALTELQVANSVGSFQPTIWVPQQTH